MIIINYNKFYNQYSNMIHKLCNQLSGFDKEDKEDCYQHICIHIFNHIENVDFTKATFGYYVFLLAKTGLRQFIYDKTKQTQFENNVLLFDNLDCTDFSSDINNDTVFCSPDLYDQIVYGVSKEVRDIRDLAIFYALLYNRDRKTYADIARMMNMSYPLFSKYINRIRKITKKVIENM